MYVSVSKNGEKYAYLLVESGCLGCNFRANANEDGSMISPLTLRVILSDKPQEQR